ncbi:MAG: D-amino-acid transaminase [Bacillota bacterium]|uniref:D-amino-acid transaminase n=1 Tax=unclassified Virgibacillus TaxID=2620237 RepID=UPI000EF4AFCB|nr:MULTISPECIES: D-amino-acid transaminase [unclassified Virgibacillus]MDY7046285.1 D-amino-acid transaminase [Virgibacillus sp. M23]
MAIYPIVLAQKTFTHQDNLKYPFEERGLQFGDGIYEVIRIYDGSYYLLKEHVDRLFRSADAVKINLAATKEEITDLLLQLLEKNKMTGDGKVYLQVSRGSAPRDHVFPQGIPANMYAYAQDLPRNLENLQKGVSVITQPDVRWENCYIKSLNLLPNVLAKQEAKEHGCYEAILHRDDLVTECSSSNIYMVKDGDIYTHPATNRILHGCVRMRVEQFANDLSISFNENGFKQEDLFTADEVFLSSSTSEVMPVTMIDNKQVQDGTPGPITRKLQEAYENDANITEGKITHTI